MKTVHIVQIKHKYCWDARTIRAILKATKTHWSQKRPVSLRFSGERTERRTVQETQSACTMLAWQMLRLALFKTAAGTGARGI